MFDQEFTTQQPGRIVRNLSQPLIECERLFGGRFNGIGSLVRVLVMLTGCDVSRSRQALRRIALLLLREGCLCIALRLRSVLRLFLAIRLGLRG